MKANGPSESYQNQDLKAMIVFANYLGPINFLLLLCLHPEWPVLLIFWLLPSVDTKSLFYINLVAARKWKERFVFDKLAYYEKNNMNLALYMKVNQ